MSTSDLSRLECLADIHEIRVALARYCRGSDQCDLDLAKSAFHADATENHGPYIGSSHAFLEMVMPIARSYEGLVHMVTDLTVEFDGEIAVSEASYLAILRDAATDFFQAGRYIDRWERRAGDWRIAARLAIVDWWRIDPRNSNPFPHDAEEITRFAGRGLQDPAVRAAIGLK